MLNTLFGSKLRVKILGLLFKHPDERYYVRQIAALITEDSTNVSRELARLKKMAVLSATTSGKQKYYQANRESPIFIELKTLLGYITEQGVDSHSNSESLVSSRFRVSPKTLAEFCSKYHIKKLSLFGSVLRDDFRPDSDVDILVDFELGHVPGFGIVGIEDELSKLTGRKVDLRTAGDLSQHLRNRIKREARVVYNS